MKTIILSPFLLLCGALAFALSTGFELDDPTLCLVSDKRCNLKRDCSKVVYERECLLAPIPLWTASEENVACCFKCCLQYFLHAFKLTGDKISSVELSRAYPTRNISAPSLNTILFNGLGSSLGLSRHVISSLGQAGNVSIMQVRFFD